MSTTQRTCIARYLGRVAYPDATRMQESLVRALAAGEGGEQLLLLEHPHVVTLGRGADRSNVLLDEATRAALGIGIHETGRGGDVTYHGPGQLVGYPIIDLKPDRCDIHGYVRDLEEVLIRTAADFGVTAGRVAGLTGIWAGDRKLAAIGVRISRWITSHGFAFNVSTDLSYFGHIVPCGIVDRGVTSLRAETGAEFALEEVAASVARHFGTVYGREMTIAPPETPGVTRVPQRSEPAGSTPAPRPLVGAEPPGPGRAGTESAAGEARRLAERREASLHGPVAAAAAFHGEGREES